MCLTGVSLRTIFSYRMKKQWRKYSQVEFEPSDARLAKETSYYRPLRHVILEVIWLPKKSKHVVPGADARPEFC